LPVQEIEIEGIEETEVLGGIDEFPGGVVVEDGGSYGL
jgi:hypothetical protein